jgi:hypothetical protein
LSSHVVFCGSSVSGSTGAATTRVPPDVAVFGVADEFVLVPGPVLVELVPVVDEQAASSKLTPSPIVAKLVKRLFFMNISPFDDLLTFLDKRMKMLARFVVPLDAFFHPLPIHLGHAAHHRIQQCKDGRHSF